MIEYVQETRLILLLILIFLPSTSATVSEYNYLTDPSLGHNYVKVPATSSEFAFSLVPVSSYGG